jgi:hypothetical protein
MKPDDALCIQRTDSDAFARLIASFLLAETYHIVPVCDWPVVQLYPIFWPYVSLCLVLWFSCMKSAAPDAYKMCLFCVHQNVSFQAPKMNAAHDGYEETKGRDSHPGFLCSFCQLGVNNATLCAKAEPSILCCTIRV